jgi:hypothetical protein
MDVLFAEDIGYDRLGKLTSSKFLDGRFHMSNGRELLLGLSNQLAKTGSSKFFDSSPGQQ